MTAARRPRPSFARIPRAAFEEAITAFEQQRDDAVARKAAYREWVVRWLEQRAATYEIEARFLETATPGVEIKPGPFTALQRRAIADELRQVSIDFERGPA